MNQHRAALGYQNFEEVRVGQIFYIDKTDFIREWWECADKVTLITRPRRFGKTLNLGTINYLQGGVICLRGSPSGRRNHQTGTINTGKCKVHFR